MGRASREKVIPKKQGRPATGRDPVYSLRLPAALVVRADEEADRAGISRSKLIHEAIERELKRRSRTPR